MTPLERYQKYTARLLDGRAWGTLSDADEEKLLEEMDDLWWELGETERAEAERWLEAERLNAPETLGLTEQEVQLGQRALHRRAT